MVSWWIVAFLHFVMVSGRRFQEEENGTCHQTSVVWDYQVQSVGAIKDDNQHEMALQIVTFDLPMQ